MDTYGWMSKLGFLRATSGLAGTFVTKRYGRLSK